jgi:triacylglycerol lipase
MSIALAVLIALVAAPAAMGYDQPSPGISPPGANDWSCKPTAAHPEPVVLVHGTEADMTVSWNFMSPALKADGYCLFALDYGDRASGPIEQSAQELAVFVDKVLAATGAPKVELLAHSQGGLMSRYYVRNLGGTEKVDDLVGLAPSNHGTTSPSATVVGTLADCEACFQQVAGSDFLRKMNAGDESPGPVSYTQIESRDDEIVTPYTSAFLAPDRNVTNELVQDSCPVDVSEHVGIAHDPVALRFVENALARIGPADPAYDPGCATS